MKWIFSALSLVILLHCFSVASGEQGKTTVVVSWPDIFKGKITLQLTDDVTNGWVITLSFPVPTPNLSTRPFQATIVQNKNDKVYTLKSTEYNSELSKGDVLEVSFLATKTDGEVAPIGTAVLKRGASA